MSQVHGDLLFTPMQKINEKEAAPPINALFPL
jgi:hypothetical protein